MESISNSIDDTAIPGFDKLSEQQILSLIDLASQGVEMTFDGNGNDVLRVVGLSKLVEIDEQKYSDYADQALSELYQDVLETKSHDIMPIYILLEKYCTNDISNVPSEELQEAYYYQVDFGMLEASNLGAHDTLVAVTEPGAPESVNWEQTVALYKDFVRIAIQLKERGFDPADLELEAAVFSCASILRDAIVYGEGIDKENLYQDILDSLYLIADAKTVHQFIRPLVGYSTDSISLDVLTKLQAAYPKDKDIKSCIKMYKRQINPASKAGRERFYALTPLGIVAAGKLGINDPIARVSVLLQRFEDLAPSQTYHS